MNIFNRQEIVKSAFTNRSNHFSERNSFGFNDFSERNKNGFNRIVIRDFIKSMKGSGTVEVPPIKIDFDFDIKF